jgi:hypothetical protein
VHPLTEQQLDNIEKLTGQSVSDVREEPTQTQIDDTRPLVEQVNAIIEGFGLTPAEWQSTPLLVNLPWFAPACGAALAELHGRMGYFPTIIRMRPVADTTPRQYEVGELIDLQQVREAARSRR